MSQELGTRGNAGGPNIVTRIFLRPLLVIGDAASTHVDGPATTDLLCPVVSPVTGLAIAAGQYHSYRLQIGMAQVKATFSTQAANVTSEALDLTNDRLPSSQSTPDPGPMILLHRIVAEWLA